MTASPELDQVHATTRELIPWWVNGRLTGTEAQQVESHLAQCAECRADVAIEQRVLAGMRHRTHVEIAPQMSFQKLWSRIEEVERDVPSRPEPIAPDAASVPSPIRPATRWRIAAGLLVGLALGLLAAEEWRSISPGAPQYRTTTVPQAATGRPAQIRVVFAPSVTVDELGGIVRGNGLAIVAGPSDAGVYGLALTDGQDTAVAEALAGLRADPRVRFAEPVIGAVNVPP
jgi:Putative zinc-finger